MLATAAQVESTTGKNAAMKIRKIAGGSPMPSQRIANGIQASGDRLRKKLTVGRNACRAHGERPSSRPDGTPSADGEAEPAADAEERRDRVVHEAPAGQLGREAARDRERMREERRREEPRGGDDGPHRDERGGADEGEPGTTRRRGGQGSPVNSMRRRDPLACAL